MLTIGSLFSGYGGLDSAVEEVFQARTVWHCEWDDAPSKILARHWPGVPNFRDVTRVDWSEVEPVDIITGGSPCQDLSAAGKRAGMTEGTRSNLWVNMREAINQLHPKFVVWENVLGALSAEATSESDMEPGSGPLGIARGGHLRALGRVLGDLTEVGYDARWTVVRASDVGAPHHRARVFLLAYPADTEGAGTHDSLPERGLPLEPRRMGRTLQQRVVGLDHEKAGDYSGTLARWEQLWGVAPNPEMCSSSGRHEVSVPFAEWMMGLPGGWVTGTPGVSRSHQLKAIGNGVVPQQAAHALRVLLDMEVPA